MITDFKSEIEVLYNGIKSIKLGLSRFEFREGETIVITGYMIDTKIRNKIICLDY